MFVELSPSEDRERKRKQKAGEEAGGEGEVEGAVLAADDDVAGEVAEAEGEAVGEGEEEACQERNLLVRVPEGRYYVLGDHRNSSNDSRVWGPVPREAIYGKAVFVYWPLDKMGVVR